MEVLLFGMIAEKAGVPVLSLEVDSMDSLRAQLLVRIPDLAQMRYAIAVDREVVTGDRRFTGKEEIAVLPPFAGG